MKLTYRPKEGFDCPSDGWPAGDHDEPDSKLAKAKVNSGWYTEAKSNSPEAEPAAKKKGVK